MRFTLSKLFLAVTLIALACAGMTIRNRLWAHGILTLTVIWHAGVLIRAFCIHGSQRAFALAFSVVGITYLLLALSTILPTIGNSLITGDILVASYNATSSPDSPRYDPIYLSSHVGELVNSGDPPLESFMLIGHCVWSWLFALLAGWFAATMYARRERLQKA
jgi:hypothetical protein